jgi:hypothetical protein
MVEKVSYLYELAATYQKSVEYVKPDNLKKWRKAYLGTLNALNKSTGQESQRKSKQLRKLVFELIESKVDNSIPMPKMTPRHKDDINVVSATEHYLKFEMDRMLTEQNNDKSERATYIDGTSWYKVSWDSLDNNYERNGDLKIDVLLADQFVPEPECTDYRDMNFCFEKSNISAARLYDMYGRFITPYNAGTNTVEVITYYFKNENGVVGRFMYAANTNQVICWDDEWLVRKVRTCKKCGTVNALSEYCRNCGHEKFSYENAKEEQLEEDIVHVYNPYEAGKTDDENDTMATEVFVEAGTEIPFYKIRQLPFVPRPDVSSVDSIYGISSASIQLEMQDSTNKILTKVEDKILKSGAVITKPKKVKLTEKDESMKIVDVTTAEEAAMIQAKQLLADVSQDIAAAQLFYESARASSGITDSYQGKRDTTASSGKAKEISAMQSAGRLESTRCMKAAAFAGVYELMFKFLLAFSDETRRFVKVLPNGEQEELLWNKYMFLRKDKYGQLYYEDDFAFSTDPAATLANNRVQMWQETLQQFTMGTFGNPQDPRTLELYWNIMDSMQYPLAKFALASIKAGQQHLPPELEQALMQSPEVLATATALLQSQGEQRGGARPNSGPEGNGQTHAANVNKTNVKNAAETRRTSGTNMAQMSGGNV